MGTNFQLRPDVASNFATEHDLLFGALTILTIFFTVVVMSLVIYFALRYRVGNNVDRSRPQHENLKLEIAWSVIPLFLALVIFGWSASLFARMRTPDKDATEIFVIGKQWMWHVQHMNGVRENNMLTLPVNKPIKLTMTSQDVIHAFYVPEFRLQYMVVPGRYTHMSFTPTKIGRFRILCNMYCGTAHSEMVGYVNVLSQSDYQRWLQGQGEDLKPGLQNVELMGKDLYEQLVCTNCHTEGDTPRGPSLYNIVGKERRLEGGGTVTIDDEYLRESIRHADRKITAGYEATMPNYDNLSEEQVMWLLAYMKTLGGRPQGGATPDSGPRSTLQETTNKTVQPTTNTGTREGM